MSNVTFKGQPVNVDGQFPRSVPPHPAAFHLVGSDLADVALTAFAGKPRCSTSFRVWIPACVRPRCVASMSWLASSPTRSCCAFLPICRSRRVAFCGAERAGQAPDLSLIRGGGYLDEFSAWRWPFGPLAGLAARAVLVLDRRDKVLHCRGARRGNGSRAQLRRSVESTELTAWRLAVKRGGMAAHSPVALAPGNGRRCPWRCSSASCRAASTRQACAAIVARRRLRCTRTGNASCLRLRLRRPQWTYPGASLRVNTRTEFEAAPNAPGVIQLCAASTASSSSLQVSATASASDRNVRRGSGSGQCAAVGLPRLGTGAQRDGSPERSRQALVRVPVGSAALNTGPISSSARTFRRSGRQRGDGRYVKCERGGGHGGVLHPAGRGKTRARPSPPGVGTAVRQFIADVEGTLHQ